MCIQEYHHKKASSPTRHRKNPAGPQFGYPSLDASFLQRKFIFWLKGNKFLIFTHYKHKIQIFSETMLVFLWYCLYPTHLRLCVFKYSSCSWHWAKAKETWGWEREVCVGWKGGSKGGVGRKWGLFVLCYLADISSMCRLAFWQAETTGALGMLSVQEISFILINATPNPSPAVLLKSLHIFFPLSV